MGKKKSAGATFGGSKAAMGNPRGKSLGGRNRASEKGASYKAGSPPRSNTSIKRFTSPSQARGATTTRRDLGARINAKPATGRTPVTPLVKGRNAFDRRPTPNQVRVARKQVAGRGPGVRFGSAREAKRAIQTARGARPKRNR